MAKVQRKEESVAAANSRSSHVSLAAILVYEEATNPGLEQPGSR
jgi:hypothetical protein